MIVKGMKDAYCREAAMQIGISELELHVEQNGLLARILNNDGSRKTVVLVSLIEHILHSEQYPPIAGDLGKGCMYNTMGKLSL